MKALYIREFGDVDGLEVRDVPDPKPSTGEVLVRVSHAGVNRADILQRKGLYPPPAGYDPRIPGLELAGTVEAVGEDAGRFAVGDKVFGITAGGAQAKLAVVPEGQLAKIPDGMSMEIAGGVPEAFVTAHDSLITQAGLKSGETVLIHAVASGVGLAAAQIARSFDAKVIGTSRTSEKIERLSEQGGTATKIVDHTVVTADGPVFAEKVLELTDGKGADVIIDLVGGAYFSENLRAASTKGRIMLIGLTAGRTAEFELGLALTKRLTIKGTVLRLRTVSEKAAAVAAFESAIATGFGGEDPRFSAFIESTFPIEQAAEAHRLIESNQTFGKLVLTL